MNPRLFRLEAFFDEYEHVAGMTVLGSSDARNRTLGEILALDVPLSCDLSLGYTPSSGSPDLIDAVAQFYGVASDHVLITNGANEAAFLAIASSTSAGTRVLVCRPAYQALSEAASLADGELAYYDYAAARDFSPDVNTIVDQINKRITVVVLNTPHNPTGKVLSEAALQRIIEASDTAGAQLIVDEVMQGIFHDGIPRTKSAVALSPRSVVIGSVSKVFGLGGLRVGWIVGPPEVIRRCKQFRYYTTICPPAVSQHLATIAVRNAQSIVGENERLVRENYRFVQAWLGENTELFDAIPPEGGTVMLIRFRAKHDNERFARRLAEERKIFLVPCETTFDLPGGYFRLGLGGDTTALRDGLATVAAFALQYGV